MKQHKINKTNTLVRSQKRQKKRKMRVSSIKEEDDNEKDDDDEEEEEDDVKVDNWQRRYFTPVFLNH